MDQDVAAGRDREADRLGGPLQQLRLPRRQAGGSAVVGAHRQDEEQDQRPPGPQPLPAGGGGRRPAVAPVRPGPRAGSWRRSVATGQFLRARPAAIAPTPTAGGRIGCRAWKRRPRPQRPAAEEEVSSFAKSLFLGEIHEEMVFPFPKPQSRRAGPDPGAEHAPCGRWPRAGTCASGRRSAGSATTPFAHLGEAGLCGLYVPEEYGGQGLSPDRLLPRLRDLRADRRHALGGDGRAPVDRDEGDRPVRLRRAEGALPARPGERPQAGRLRADRARCRLGRLQRSVPRRPAARRLLGAERGEALHRQRRHRRRLRHLRPRRGRRQGPPHRADPREGHEGVRGRRALRHDGPAGQRPAPPPLQRRPGAAGERPRRARRRVPDRDAHPQQRPPQPRHRLGRRDQGAARPDRSPTSRSGGSSIMPWPTSSWSRTRSPGWSPTCSGSSR